MQNHIPTPPSIENRMRFKGNDKNLLSEVDSATALAKSLLHDLMVDSNIKRDYGLVKYVKKIEKQFLIVHAGFAKVRARLMNYGVTDMVPLPPTSDMEMAAARILREYEYIYRDHNSDCRCCFCDMGRLIPKS